MVTRTLARNLVASRYDDIPQAVLHEAARALLNWLGCAIGSSRHETVECALAAVTPFSGPPQAAVLGRTERLDILHAALINGISSHVLDFDDTHARAIHPSAPVLPALLALAEWRNVSGAEFAHAFVLGVEAEERIGLSVFPEHYDIGWHITGTAGVFGAAAATSKVLGLNHQQMTWALGIAATQSAGLREMFGSMCKSFHSGRAAENGLLAAFLAREGFTSVEDGIGGPRCFAHVLGESPDLDRVSRDLGESYEITRNTYKAFPCGVVIHPVIDACLRLRQAPGFSVSAIDAVKIRANPLVIELTGRKAPMTTLEGKLSVYHCAAAALIAGRLGEQECKPEIITRADIVALRSKVRVQVDQAIREDEAYVTLCMPDGRKLREHVEHAIGTAERPMSDAEIETKFKGLCEPYLPPATIQRLIDRCWGITDVADAGSLARLGSAG